MLDVLLVVSVVLAAWAVMGILAVRRVHKQREIMKRRLEFLERIREETPPE